MRSVCKNIQIALVILLFGSSLSIGQETDGEIRGIDPEERKKLEKASEEALKDITELAKEAEKLVAFRQANEKAYGLPSELEKLKKMQEATESFADNELEEINDFYTSLLKKYNANGSNDFNVVIDKVINPFPWNKTSFAWSAGTLEQNIAWFKQFRSDLDEALDKAEEQADITAAEQNKAKELSDFPEDDYNKGDLADVKEQMLKALMASVIKNTDEVTGIAVISDWVEGIYTDSKQPYRKINGTVLFADSDGDDISRFTSYVFISNKVNGDWQPLKFKAFCNGCPEGWAEAGSGSMGSGSGKGVLGTVLWLLLSLSNILAGLIASQTLLKKYAAGIEKITAFLAPYSIQIGFIALVAGILGFVISLLSFRLLSGIIPQVTAVLLGFILAYDYIKMNAKGKIKDQIDNSQAMISQMNNYSQIIGVSGLIIGVFYLFFSGLFYFI